MSEHYIECFFTTGKCRFSTREQDENNLVFIAGSASDEFKNDIRVLMEVLLQSGYKGYFATEEALPNRDIWCSKICSKIIFSKFCLVLLNSPMHKKMINFPPEDELREKWKDIPQYEEILYPSPNLYFEYGLMVGLGKIIFPFLKRGIERPPFDIQNLELGLYNNLDELKSKLTDYLGTLSTYFRSKGIEEQEFSPSTFQREINKLKEDSNLSSINDILYSYWPDFQKTVFRDDETKFSQILRSFKETYELINLDDEYFPVTNAIVTFSYILGIKIVQEEKWNLLSLLIEQEVFIKSRGKRYSIFSLPPQQKIQVYKITISNLIKQLSENLEYFNFSSRDKLLDALVLTNFLICFKQKRVYPFFLRFDVDRIEEFLYMVFIQEDLHVLKLLFPEITSPLTLLYRLASFLTINLPRFDDFINFDLEDLRNRTIFEKINYFSSHSEFEYHDKI